MDRRAWSRSIAAALVSLAALACDGGTSVQQNPVVPDRTAGTSPGAVAGTNGGGGAGAPAAAGQGGTAAPAAGTSGAAAGTGGAPAIAGQGGQGGGAGAAGQAGSGDSGQDGGTDAGTPDSGAPAGPTLPPIDDPGARGPFGVERVDTAPGLTTHSLFVPDAVGTHGKHPAVVWTCGNGGTVGFYASFLEHLASHGFLVVADKASTSDREAEVDSQLAAIDWLLAQNADQSSRFAGKVDVDHIAVMGHSLGSLASFATAAQSEHIATSVHYSGGLTGNPVGFDERWLAEMTRPAAFLCGGADGTASPSCAQDFENAPPALPVFYGVLAGASHIGPFAATPRGGEYGRAGVAWLRWQLAEDPAFASWFVGASCTLCSSPWTAQQHNLQ